MLRMPSFLYKIAERISGGTPRQFLELMDYMISFRFNQSDTERIGRTMTLTKPALRSSLGDDHFKQAVWVSAFTALSPPSLPHSL